MIYEYCLMVGKVYPLFSKLSWETYGYKRARKHRVPDTALLQVSRQVNLEAEKILYSRNTFVMPVLKDMVRLFNQYLRTPRRNALLWIRSVEIAFHFYDLSRNERKAILSSQYTELTNDVLPLRKTSPPDLNQVGLNLHDSLCRGLTHSAWPRKAELVTRGLRLHDLWVYVDGAWCICHCCCLEDEAVQCLTFGFVHGLPDIIEVVGLSETEVDEELTEQILEGHKEYEMERVQNNEEDEEESD